MNGWVVVCLITSSFFAIYAEESEPEYFVCQFIHIPTSEGSVNLNEAVGKTYFSLKKITALPTNSDVYDFLHTQLYEEFKNESKNVSRSLNERLSASKKNKIAGQNYGTPEQLAHVQQMVQKLGVDPDALSITVDPSNHCNLAASPYVGVGYKDDSKSPENLYYGLYINQLFFNASYYDQLQILSHELEHLKHMYDDSVGEGKAQHFNELIADAAIFINSHCSNKEKFLAGSQAIAKLRTSDILLAMEKQSISPVWRSMVIREQLKKVVGKTPSVVFAAPLSCLGLFLFNRSLYECDFFKVALCKTVVAATIAYAGYKLIQKVCVQRKQKE